MRDLQARDGTYPGRGYSTVVILALLVFGPLPARSQLFPSLDDKSEAALLLRLELFAGISQPVGAFGDNDPFSEHSGFAETGVAIGVSYFSELFPGWGIAATTKVHAHAYNAKQWIKEFTGVYLSFSGDTRVLLSATVGPFAGWHLLDDEVMLYLAPQVGLLYVNYPNLTVHDWLGEHVDIAAPWRLVPGLNVNAGVMLRRYEFGVHFLLGSAEYQPAYYYRRETGTFLSERKPVKAILLAVGIILN